LSPRPVRLGLWAREPTTPPWEGVPYVTDIWRGRLRILGVLIAVVMTALVLSSSALSSSLPTEPPPPTEITLGAGDDGRRVQLREGEALVISLEANPSTGYGWELDRGPLDIEGQSLLVQTAEEFQTQQELRSPGAGVQEVAPLLGAPETQILQFQARATGETDLRLVYRRPWEADAPPAGEYSLHVQAIGPFTGPEPVAMQSASQPSSEPSVDLGDDGQLGLPLAFNWCNLGACTPVRNQGACGSCWAFSTVGPLESNILIHDGVDSDLSEQYLLSCNTDGWDCGGGWFAHDYHEWKIPPGEPEAGAVYEAEFPYSNAYTLQVELCNAPHTHHDNIVDWEYVGNYYSVPSATSIKQAILDHGPISVAIYIGSAFRSYPGGVFETSEVGTPNHAVVLVGWDDDQGTNGIWYLRNSWGAGWGESGYMRIGYGISSVGYGANYVVYYPSCYDLETKVYPVGAGTVVADPLPSCNGGGYEPDKVVELTAIANPGWTFSAWGGDGSGSSNALNITMDSDKSVAAHFMCDGCSVSRYYPLGMKSYEGPPEGWVTITAEDFEGLFPDSWNVLDNEPGDGEYYWGKRDCRPFNGSYSGWPVGAGSDGSSLSCGSNYPDYADSWMVYGPFSLAGASAADLQFKLWLDSESSYDYLFWGASTNGTSFYGMGLSGYSAGWDDRTLDLSSVYTIGNLLGKPEVWIAIKFHSDGDTSYPEGAYVDDVVLRKYVSSTGQPPPLHEASPSSGPGAQIIEQPMVATRRR